MNRKIEITEILDTLIDRTRNSKVFINIIDLAGHPIALLFFVSQNPTKL